MLRFSPDTFASEAKNQFQATFALASFHCSYLRKVAQMKTRALNKICMRYFCIFEGAGTISNLSYFCI